MLGRLICPSWGKGKPLRWRASLVHSHLPVLLLLFECNFLVLYRFFSSPPPAADCVWINSGEFRVFGPFCCLFSPATITSHPTAVRVGIKKNVTEDQRKNLNEFNITTPSEAEIPFFMELETINSQQLEIFMNFQHTYTLNAAAVVEVWREGNKQWNFILLTWSQREQSAEAEENIQISDDGALQLMFFLKWKGQLLCSFSVLFPPLTLILPRRVFMLIFCFLLSVVLCYVLAVASLPSQRPIHNVKHEQTPAPTGSRLSHQQSLFCKSVQISAKWKKSRHEKSLSLINFTENRKKRSKEIRKFFFLHFLFLGVFTAVKKLL